MLVVVSGASMWGHLRMLLIAWLLICTTVRRFSIVVAWFAFIHLIPCDLYPMRMLPMLSVWIAYFNMLRACPHAGSLIVPCGFTELACYIGLDTQDIVAHGGDSRKRSVIPHDSVMKPARGMDITIYFTRLIQETKLGSCSIKSAMLKNGLAGSIKPRIFTLLPEAQINGRRIGLALKFNVDLFEFNTL